MGTFLLEDNPFQTVKGLVDYVEDRELGAHVLRLPRFILVVHSSSSWLAVSTLGIV